MEYTRIMAAALLATTLIFYIVSASPVRRSVPKSVDSDLPLVIQNAVASIVKDRVRRAMEQNISNAGGLKRMRRGTWGSVGRLSWCLAKPHLCRRPRPRHGRRRRVHHHHNCDNSGNCRQ